MEARGRRRLFTSLTAKLAIGFGLLVVATLAPALFLVTTHHLDRQLGLERRRVREQGELIRIAFEHQMLHKDRSLIRRMVQEYGSNPEVERVMIFDRKGELQHTNRPELLDRVFDRHTSPACAVCHEKPPSARTGSIVIDTESGSAIRNVIPLKNREECWTCHGSEHTINGVLIIDTTIESMREQTASDVRILALGVCALALILVGGTSLVVRRLLLRPLARLEQTARAISEGDFGQRVEAEGESALASLGREFNAMADSVSDLLAELRWQRSQLEEVMNSVDDGVLVVDETFTIVGVNEALAKRLHTSREELLHRQCWTIWGQSHDCRKEEMSRCPATECFRTGVLQTSFRTRVDGQTGAERQEEVYASPIFGESGRVVQVVEVWRDITERRAREAKMSEFQRLASLGMLAAGFSHEMNTPLNTMLFCVEGIRDDLAAEQVSENDREHALKQAELTRGEILRCREITRQFLSLSRGQSPTLGALDLPETIRAVIAVADPTAKKADVRLRVVDDGHAATVVANDGAVQQVLLNLLINAIQASPTGGEVRITCTTDSVVRLRVEDQGPGMSREVAARVFEPFFSKRPSGTGLGLFVSINLARQWGGDISLQSQPGRGSTFEVTFPLHGSES